MARLSDGSPEPLRAAVVCAADISVKMLLCAQIDAARAAGHEVEAVCSAGPHTEELRGQGLTLHAVDIPRSIAPLRDLLALLALWRLFRRRRYTIVHTHTPKAAFLGQLAAWLAGVPVRVNTIHGLYYLAFPSGFRRSLFKRLELAACRLAHHVFSQSQEDVDLILREHLLPPERLEYLGNGVNLQKFDPARFTADERIKVRRELGIPDDAFVVGIVARMVIEKGFRELFEAFAEFRRTAPDACLLHVGFVDTSRRDEVTPAEAEQYGIGDSCRFLGQRDDVPRLMTAMDVFCLPSYREGYPRSVMEANAMGVPVIATNIRGCREAVMDGLNGLLVPPGQVEPLVAALLRLYQDERLRGKLAEGARRRAEQEFDETRVIRKVLAAYDSLVMRKHLR